MRNGENGEYLSLVSVSTNPPLVCHGSGPTIEHAQNEASLGALRSLASRGLDMSIDSDETLTSGSTIGQSMRTVGTSVQEQEDDNSQMNSTSEKA